MSGLGRRFHPAEVQPEAGPVPYDAEIARAMVAARELEALTARDVAGPTVGFEDRVMAMIAMEPAPRLFVRSGRAVRGGLPVAFLVSVRDAWRLATGAGRPFAVRAQAMAFVLLVILATGSLTTVFAVGAASFLTAGPTPTPSLPLHTANPAVLPTQSPTDVVTPTSTPSPSPSGEDIAEPTESAEPGPTSSPIDGVAPGGTTEPHDTAKPTNKPKPTETAEPTETDETAEPTETDDDGDDGGDDHGDDGGGGGGGHDRGGDGGSGGD